MSSSPCLSTPAQLERFRLASLRGAVRMEAAGMRHSSGKSATAQAKRVLGLKRSATSGEVIASLSARMEEVFPCNSLNSI